MARSCALPPFTLFEVSKDSGAFVCAVRVEPLTPALHVADLDQEFRRVEGCNANAVRPVEFVPCAVERDIISYQLAQPLDAPILRLATTHFVGCAAGGSEGHRTALRQNHRGNRCSGPRETHLKTGFRHSYRRRSCCASAASSFRAAA